jgi:hypothetical protein
MGKPKHSHAHFNRDCTLSARLLTKTGDYTHNRIVSEKAIFCQLRSATLVHRRQGQLEAIIHLVATENVTVNTLIERLWVAPEDAEWKPKTDVLSLTDVKQWMSSDDIEVLGFTDAMIHDARFRIEPQLPLEDYVLWVKHYCGRCFRENPDGDWSDSSYSVGWELVQIFIKLWDDNAIPRKLLMELKAWIADLYKNADDPLRICIVHATLEHLFERKAIRKYFSDWRNDAILTAAYDEACLWDRKTPLSR